METSSIAQNAIQEFIDIVENLNPIFYFANANDITNLLFCFVDRIPIEFSNPLYTLNVELREYKNFISDIYCNVLCKSFCSLAGIEFPRTSYGIWDLTFQLNMYQSKPNDLCKYISSPEFIQNASELLHSFISAIKPIIDSIMQDNYKLGVLQHLYYDQQTDDFFLNQSSHFEFAHKIAMAKLRSENGMGKSNSQIDFKKYQKKLDSACL